MKEAIVSAGPRVTIHDIPIPSPGRDEVVIKVVVSGCNPKDWKIPDLVPKYEGNSGDDVAGYVHSVGKDVYEFREGDRVASFHQMMTPGGSFAEYAVGQAHTTFHIPKNTSFEQAATIPLAAMTSAIGLFLRLGLPDPWTPVKDGVETPLIVYGGASAVGAYAIKLASLANIHPIIAVAGRGIPFVQSLLDASKGDAVVDYRDGDEEVVNGIKEKLNGRKCEYAFDATSEKGSYTNIVQVLESTGRLTLVLPGKKYEGIPESIQKSITSVGEAHKGDKEFAHVYFKYMARGLKEGWFSPHPHEVVAGGLGGVETGLRWLKEGKASGVKYVFKIGEEGEKEKL
ncbi:GroES-like protein [Ophiobolus disseminans]|uniref:GroES-like protein n=1 Tax=Ophiobolus disseminans TaxID=1469910 RepID=A0A6A6ZPZ8_9PLEO|nr:GroES-like protein [Ophiobolus disseminans]